MDANDVLIDFLEDNRRRLHRFLGKLEADCLHWKPDPGANSIAVTVWHMGRLFDVFLTRLARGEPAENECWYAEGWAEKTGYDPRGLGRDGWGSVNGYTAEQVADIPRFSTEQLLDYYDAVLLRARGFVEATQMEQLLAPAPGFEGQFTQYQIAQMAILDNARHLGEIFAIKEMWTRRAGS